MIDMGLFDNAKFGDRFISMDGDIIIYQQKNYQCDKYVHYVMNERMCYIVNDDGKYCGVGHPLDIVSRLDDDDDFITAVAVKEIGDSNKRDIEMFNKGFKKALNVL